MQDMLEIALKKCAERGLYTPICCFDGQWYCLVIRDKSDKSLTVLHLQKDVYNEAKQIAKGEVVKQIASSNVVAAENYGDFEEKAHASLENKDNNYNERLIVKYLEINGIKAGGVY